MELKKRHIKKVSQLKKKIKHISGPKKVDYKKNEVIVVCLVKNGAEYIKSFINHYFSLGFKHVVFLDNGSEDKTVSIAKKYENITILKTKLSYKKYQCLMKQYLVTNFSKNRWCLYADIDEFFDFPFSNKISLNSFIKYLNKRSYNAVAAQMMDMFSNKGLFVPKNKNNSIKSKYQYYYPYSILKKDLNSIYNRYNVNNTVSNKRIKFYIGGIHKKLFGLDEVFLTKHPLVFSNHRINPCPHPHLVDKANIADISCILFHYLFVDSFVAKVKEIAKNENYRFSFKYKMYNKILKQKPDINKIRYCKFKDKNELVKKKILVISNDYMRWVKKFINKLN